MLRKGREKKEKNPSVSASSQIYTLTYNNVEKGLCRNRTQELAFSEVLIAWLMSLTRVSSLWKRVKRRMEMHDLFSYNVHLASKAKEGEDSKYCAEGKSLLLPIFPRTWIYIVCVPSMYGVYTFKSVELWLPWGCETYKIICFLREERPSFLFRINCFYVYGTNARLTRLV